MNEYGETIELNGIALLGWLDGQNCGGRTVGRYRPNQANSDPNEANTTQDTLTIYHRHDDWLLIWDGYTVREAIQSTALGKADQPEVENEK